MINVGFSACTAFHLAEYRIPKPLAHVRLCGEGEPAGGSARGGQEGAWTSYEDVRLDDGDFAEIGGAFPDSRVRRGRVGGAPAALFSIPDAVDHALDWMTENRR